MKSKGMRGGPTSVRMAEAASTGHSPSGHEAAASGDRAFRKLDTCHSAHVKVCVATREPSRLWWRQNRQAIDPSLYVGSILVLNREVVTLTIKTCSRPSGSNGTKTNGSGPLNRPSAGVTTVPPYYQLRKHSAGPILEARYQKLRRLPPADSDDYQKWVALINFQASQMSRQTACCRWFWFRCYQKA